MDDPRVKTGRFIRHLKRADENWTRSAAPDIESQIDME
jgi:hypothetical protein